MDSDELARIGMTQVEYLRAERDSSSTLTNRPRIDKKKVRTYNALGDISDLLISGGNRKHLIRDHSRTDEPWFVVVDQEDGASVFGCTESCIHAYLNQRKVMALSTGFAPPISHLINGLAPDCLDQVKSVVDRVVDFHSGPGGMTFGLENVIWYLRGSLVKWVDLLSGSVPLSVMTLATDGRSAIPPEKTLESRWSIVVIGSPMLPGLSMRAIGTHVLGGFGQLILSLKKTREIGTFPESDRDRAAGRALSALGVCKSLWSVL